MVVLQILPNSLTQNSEITVSPKARSKAEMGTSAPQAAIQNFSVNHLYSHFLHSKVMPIKKVRHSVSYKKITFKFVMNHGRNNQ